MTAAILLANALVLPFTKPSPPPPPPPAQPTIYVNFGDTIQDNTPDWGNGSFLFHPGITPDAGLTPDGEQQVLTDMRRIIGEGGFNLAVQEFTGQSLLLDQSEEIVIGGNLLWCASVFPNTSGIHFRFSFTSDSAGAHLKAFSDAPLVFGLTNYEMIARSAILEGVTGPGGWLEDLSVGGYANNFTISGGWTPPASAVQMQATYGVAVETPEPDGKQIACAVVLPFIAMRRVRRRR